MTDIQMTGNPNCPICGHSRFVEGEPEFIEIAPKDADEEFTCSVFNTNNGERGCGIIWRGTRIVAIQKAALVSKNQIEKLKQKIDKYNEEL